MFDFFFIDFITNFFYKFVNMKNINLNKIHESDVLSLMF